MLDEYGDEVDIVDLVGYLSDDFDSIDYSELKSEIKQVVDVDASKSTGSEVEEYLLQIDNAPNLRFAGSLIAKAASTDNQAVTTNYSGQTGRWTELALYKTKGGKFVCHQIRRTRWQGERDRFSGKVCETLAEVKEFFGHRWLAKELYTEAGIDNVIEIE